MPPGGRDQLLLSPSSITRLLPSAVRVEQGAERPAHLLSLASMPGSAARPASRRATGTRNGEQET